MIIRLSIAIITVFALIGCCSSMLKDEYNWKVFPHPNHSGLFLINYDPDLMLKRYGDQPTDKVEAAETSHGDAEINKSQPPWARDMMTAIPRFLIKSALTPPECTGGVVVTGTSGFEGGTAASSFRCK